MSERGARTPLDDTADALRGIASRAAGLDDLAVTVSALAEGANRFPHTLQNLGRHRPWLKPCSLRIGGRKGSSAVSTDLHNAIMDLNY
jgi:hypothetical protein